VSNRTIQIYYFYTEDASVPRASHICADEALLRISIRENQQASDECICLMFEILNSEGDDRFKKLSEQAMKGTKSKSYFVKEVMRQEFYAVKKTQALLGHFGLSKSEISESYYYNRFIQSPDDFEEYLSYKKEVSPDRDQEKEYGQLYDSLRKV